jgi:hypothetical protein
MARITYTLATATKFCEAIAEGSKSIRSVCKLAGMPSKAVVFRWLRDHPEFQEMYELAKDEQADTFVDEIVEIADKCKASKSAIQKARLQIYAREVAAAKMRPKKYGSKMQLTGDEGRPLSVEIVQFGQGQNPQ